MSILEDLPFSLCEAGPKQVDGVGNFYVQVLAPAPSQRPVWTLFLLDSHGEISSWTHKPDYDPIQQSQIDWFVNTSKALQSKRENDDKDYHFHGSLVFQHIPLPEFKDSRLVIHSGHRREPTEGPSINSHFYDALVKQNVVVLACGHDHANDFCALLQQGTQPDGSKNHLGPWLCYGSVSGFGGYCSYGKKRYHRQMRVFEHDMTNQSLETWMRDEYTTHKVGELVLVQQGTVFDPPGKHEGRRCVMS